MQQFHDNRFHLVWTPFQKRDGRRVLQAVGLVCPPSLGSGGELTLRVGGRKYVAGKIDLLRYPTGYFDQNDPAIYLWLIPRPARPVRCEAVWKTPLGYVCRDSIQLVPANLDNIFVTFKTHVDLGYTARVDEVVRDYQTTHLDKLLDNLERTADRPVGQRFVWTMPTWMLERCLDETVTADRRKRLEKAIRNGQVVFGLTPFTTHSEFFGLEEMCRSLLAARRLADRFGVPVPRAAKLTDVPAHTASYAMALAAAGGEFLQIGTNPDCLRPDVPGLFWWTLPDTRRILCHYHGAYSTSLLPPPEYVYRDWLAVQVSHDNAGPTDLALLDQIQWIAEHFDRPLCRVGRLEDFADAIARDHGKNLPTVEGEPVDWWIHGIASQAAPTALARRAKDRLPTVEIVQSLTSLATDKAPPLMRESLPASRDACDHGYEQLALYTEHTWGDHANDAAEAFPDGKRYTAAVSTSGKQKPPLDRWVGSWRDKALCAERADATARAAEAQAFDQAAEAFGSTRGGVGVLLFNVASWTRGGLVRMSDEGLPAGEFELIDAATGAAVIYHREPPAEDRVGSIEFVAPPVPAGGYLYLEAKPVRRRSLPGPKADWNDKHLTLHFESYALQFHAKGGMCRWHDRARSMQWCSNEVDFPMGTYLYEMPGGKRIRDFARRVHGNCWEQTAGFFNRRDYDGMADFGPVGGSPARVTPVIGPMRSQVIVEADCPERKVSGRRSGDAKRYRSTYTVYTGQRDLHVKIELLGKQPTFAAEAGYGFFPFYGSKPFVLIDRIAHLVEPSQDFMRGVNTAHMAVHHGVRIELEHAGVNFYPLDTPLVGFGAPGAYRFDDQHGYDDGVLYSTLFNNGWGTNFAQWQGGDLSYEFVMRPTGNDEWDGGLARGGLETFRPIVGTVVRGMKAPPARSLVRIEPDLVQLVTMKPASFGEGLIVRLWSADPDPLTAKLSLPFLKRGDAANICDLLERPTGERVVVDKQGSVKVPMKPHEIVTLRLRPSYAKRGRD